MIWLAISLYPLAERVFAFARHSAFIDLSQPEESN
jgi:hypothetical protein